MTSQEAFSFNLSKEQFEGHIGIIYGAAKRQAVGSGFAFGSHKDVVTCAHVLATAQTSFHETNLLFITSDPVPRQLKLKYILPRYDLVVFTPTPEIKGEPLKVGDFKKMRPGDPIVYVGYDQRRQPGPISVINRAQITATGNALNDGAIIDFLEFEGIGIPGYSGGAVFNSKGELIGAMREAWTKKGLVGGPEILINRAFSLDILSVLDAQVFSGAVSNAPSTNKFGMALQDILEIGQGTNNK